VLKWPDAQAVARAVRDWAQQLGGQKPELVRAGYFGSYARGDWGVGSDVDLVVIVDRAEEPFERRSPRWDASQLPVPADVLVYTELEWNALTAATPFAQRVEREAVWVYTRKSGP
jgi:predicted nucleotidyltransferase